MGGWFSTNRKCSIVCVGLDNSGKSTIINKLKPDEAKVEDVQATVGFSKEEVTFGNIDFSVFDMAGAQRFRSLWEKQYSNIAGIIFVIDSSDDFRMVSVKYELELLLQCKAIAEKPDVPILFFGNKMDLPKALNAAELSDRLELAKMIATRPFTIVRSNALAGVGLQEGMKWLSTRVNSQQQ